MRAYLTHCSAQKNHSLQDSGEKVTPDRLYTAASTQAFMSRCKERRVDWAILSDLYGVWFFDVEHEWYEKHPDTVTDQEFGEILNDFDQKLKNYDEIWFYFNSECFHSFYQEILRRTELKDRVRQFTDIEEIVS